MISVILLQATLFAVIALGIRAQIAATRAFDLSLGAATLLSAETYVVVSSLFTNVVITTITACLSALVLSVGFMLAWNLTVTGVLRNTEKQSTSSASIFIASMGLTTAASGFVGLTRGPGLVQSEARFGEFLFGTVPVNVALAIAIPASITLLVLVFARRRAITNLEAFSTSPAFAMELGIESKYVATVASVASGCAAAAAGIHFAVLDGSRTQLAYTPVLFGICGALVFQRKTLPRAAMGGFVVGAAFGMAQLNFDHSVAQLFLFLFVGALLVLRRSGRSMSESE